jgi:Fe-S-cluster-containing dehydrogenase component
MDKNRRDALKKIGCAAAGLGCLPAAGCIDLSHERTPEGGTRQLAMVVDIARVNDEVAHACIEACHTAHNVPASDNPQREVKWIWQEEFERAFPDQVHPQMAAGYHELPVLLMCNHCETPACVKVCPTAATWKRKSDGIVMMDMHRCIGCRYCVVACPYGSRSFNWGDPDEQYVTTSYPSRGRGVVEKCNFCAERLRVGEEPLCVLAAREVPGGAGALTFGDLTDPDSEVSRLLRATHTISRKNALGTGPNVYYILPDDAGIPQSDHVGSAS